MAPQVGFEDGNIYGLANPWHMLSLSGFTLSQTLHIFNLVHNRFMLRTRGRESCYLLNFKLHKHLDMFNRVYNPILGWEGFK